MNLKFNHKLFAANDDSGTANGGASSGFSFMAADSIDDDESNGVDIGAGADSSYSDDDYRTYHRLGKSGEPAQSPLSKAADSVTSSKEEKDSNKGKGDKEVADKEVAAKNDPDKKEASPEEEVKELLDLKIEEIKTGSGKPISKASGEVISKFKSHLTRLNQEITELKAKEPSSNPQLTEEFEKIKKERDELKNQIDTELFEKSDGFKQAFIQPVIESHNKISKYFGKLDPKEDADEITSVRALLEKSVAFAEAGDQDSFAETLDQIVDDHIGGGSSKKALFAADMMNLFKVTQDKVQAFTDKNMNRKKVVEAKLEQARRNNTVSIDRDIDTHIAKFEIEKKAILDGLDDKEREAYTSKYKNNVKKFKESITDFAITGKISEDFAHVIQQGITAEAIKHENSMLFAGYKDSMNLVTQKNDEIKELKAKLAKLSGEPTDSKRKGGYVKSSEPAKEESEFKSSIFAALQKVRGE